MVRRFEDKKEESKKKLEDKKKLTNKNEQITTEEKICDENLAMTEGNKLVEVEREVETEKKETPRQRIKRIRELSNETHEIIIKGNIKYRFNRYGNSNKCAEKMLKENQKELLLEKIGQFKELNQESFKQILNAFILGMRYKNGERLSVTKILLKNLNSFKDLDHRIILEIIENCKHQYGTLELLFQKRKHFNGIENLTDEEIKLWYGSVSSYIKNKYKTREEFKKVLLK